MKELDTTIELLPENIDKVSSDLVSYLEGLNTKSTEITKLRLNVEQALLTWKEDLGQEALVNVSVRKALGQKKIVLSAEGKESNPLLFNDELGPWMQNLVSHLENVPSYSYSHKTNITVYKIPRKKINPFLILLFSVALAVFFGLLGQSLFSSSLKTQIIENFLIPICKAYINVLCFCGIPLIFLSVCLGAIGVGDIKTFSKIGLGMVKRYILFLLFAVLLALGLSLPFFNIQFGQSNISFHAKNIFDVLLSWLPTNVFSPFIDCNAMQLIIMGIVFAIAILKLDNKNKYITGFFTEINNLMLLISEWFTKLIPLFVFITVFESILQSDVIVLLQAAKSLLITTSAQVLFVLLLIAIVCIKDNIKFSVIVKKLSDLFLIAFGTNSCSASIPEHYNLSATKLGVSETVFSFGIPIGTSIFKPATAIRYLILTFFMATEYNISVAPSWLIMVVFVCLFLSIASPAIPGGALLLCPMLFSQLGIPQEAINQMLATDIFFDAICTAFNQVSVQLLLTQFASSKNLINRKVLEK